MRKRVNAIKLDNKFKNLKSKIFLLPPTYCPLREILFSVNANIKVNIFAK